MTKANAYLRLAEDDGARFRPEREFNAGRICSVTVIAVTCPTSAEVWAQAAHVRARRAQAFRPRVVSPHDERPKENGDGAGPVSQAQAGAKSGGAPTSSALAELQPPAVPGRISVHRTLEVTADHFGMTVPEILSDCRKQPLCRRRQVAMFVARRMTGRSLPFIGRHMGGRDHTTILHGVWAIQGLLDAGDGETIAAVNQIIERLQVTGGAHDGN